LRKDNEGMSYADDISRADAISKSEDCCDRALQTLRAAAHQLKLACDAMKESGMARTTGLQKALKEAGNMCEGTHNLIMDKLSEWGRR